jgi:RNA polymerase sigma factor (sigma-70 family)
MAQFSMLQRGAADSPEPVPSKKAMPVEELVRRCLVHDADAWEELLERFQALVWSVPLRLGLGHHEAAEVFQDVFESLLRNLPSLHEPERLASWLYTAARRLSLRRIATRRRQSLQSQIERMASTEPGPPRPALTDEIVQAERRGEVLRLIEALPDRCRRLLTALFLDPDEPDYDRIAETLGVARGSIGPSRLRCLKKLHELMKESGYPFGPR